MIVSSSHSQPFLECQTSCVQRMDERCLLLVRLGTFSHGSQEVEVRIYGICEDGQDLQLKST